MNKLASMACPHEAFVGYIGKVAPIGWPHEAYQYINVHHRDTYWALLNIIPGVRDDILMELQPTASKLVQLQASSKCILRLRPSAGSRPHAVSHWILIRLNDQAIIQNTITTEAKLQDPQFQLQ